MNGPIIDINFTGDNFWNLAYEFDLSKSNLFRVTSPRIDELKDWAKDKYEYYGLMLEGVHSVNLYYGYNSILFECVTGNLDYPAFQKLYIEGNQKAYQWAKDITKNIKLPDYIAVMMVYSFIVANVKYDSLAIQKRDNNGEHEINAWMSYGAICECSAVCEGSSWGMIRMLQALDIVAFPVFGYRNGGYHQWLKVKLNDNWYNIEPTVEGDWQNIPLNQFLVSDEEMKRKGYSFTENLNFFKATDPQFDGEGVYNLMYYYYDHIKECIAQGVEPGWGNIRFVLY